MTNSLRNVVKRREHKERSQLSSRARLGLLEKHKDYVLRARDYHRKQDRLKSLREKALFRNPDEFYFKMINTRTKVCWGCVAGSCKEMAGIGVMENE
ncbi:UTP11-like, U3 small nucleolar ribonucleoprotein [Quaeritorhiza haematococci]|nr:UTP11-like, U3 small nucleolar ribonucleoprotein [Quaeritorhiza haematococci]